LRGGRGYGGMGLLLYPPIYKISPFQKSYSIVIF